MTSRLRSLPRFCPLPHPCRQPRRQRLAEELDPTSTGGINNSAVFWYQAGDFERSLEATRKLGSLASATLISTADYLAQGRSDLASRAVENADIRQPAVRLSKAMVLARSGARDEALHLVRPLEDDPRIARQWFALFYAAMDDAPSTIKWLERSADAREWQVLNMAVNPAYERMRSTPAFRALERRIGLPIVN